MSDHEFEYQRKIGQWVEHLIRDSRGASSNLGLVYPYFSHPVTPSIFSSLHMHWYNDSRQLILDYTSFLD